VKVAGFGKIRAGMKKGMDIAIDTHPYLILIMMTCSGGIFPW
jgi:hypothetical protein